LRRSTLPGLPERWDDPPLVDLRALAFARPTHRPSCPKAWRAMPVVARSPVARSVAAGATTGCPATVPLRVGLVGEPTSVPEAGPCSGCPDQRPGAVHADPVARALVSMAPPNRRVLGCSWGAPVASAGASLPVAPGKPVARCLEALPHCSPLRLPGARRCGAAPPLAAPVARCSSLRSVASRPVRSRLRLVNQSRFPLPSARRLRSEDPVIRFRLACAPRYVAYLRERITPGQGVFLNPQGYPRTFSSIPRNVRVVHRSCTGMSPDSPARAGDSLTDRTRSG